MSLSALLLLYLAFRAKQLLCDFFLQPAWMATTKSLPLRDGGGRALFLHAAIHAAGTGLVVCFFAADLLWLAAVDFALHAAIDRAKALWTRRKGWGPTDTPFWWLFGADQEAHNLTHLAYIVVIVLHVGGG